MAFTTVAPRDSVLYALHQTALTTEEIGLGEAEEMTMAPWRRLWKVLFVDDEEGIRRVMAITLADAGYEVLTAPEGDTTMSLCRTESKAVPRRAVFRSSFPGHCTRRPGLGTIRSRPCHRDPACSFAPYQTKRNGLQAVA